MRRSLVAIVIVGLSAGCSIFGDFTGYSEGQPTSPDAAATGQDGGDAAPLPNSDAGPNTDTDGGTPNGDAAVAANFTDLFDRDNGPIGNGWLEKTPNVFTIASGRAVALSGNWVERFIYRPAIEDILDVETSVEVTWLSTPPTNCDASILARVQSSTAGENNGLYGYTMFVDDRTTLALARIDHSIEVSLGGTALPQAINTTDSFRYRLRVHGTSPVIVEAIIERRVPPSTDWIMFKSLTKSDSSPQRIQTAGAVGLTSDQNATFAYDVFTRTSL